MGEGQRQIDSADSGGRRIEPQTEVLLNQGRESTFGPLAKTDSQDTKSTNESEPSNGKDTAQKNTGKYGPFVRDVPTTYCNPMNLDYAFVPEKDYSRNNAHRSSADPSCVRVDGKYFLFSTNQEGYWSSENLAKWQFIPHKFKANFNDDQVCAPGAWAGKDGVLFLPSFTDQVQMPLYQSKDPQTARWSELTKNFPIPAWDPALFQDDDNKIYCYWGSSNLLPIRGVQLDPTKGYNGVGQPKDLLYLDPDKHGWERFGENNLSLLKGYIEGPAMNKINGTYYLQYAAPGTEWNVYGDGVYTSKSPLGPFKYQEHNPFSWKPTGFVTGAGHGSTFDDNSGNLWHVASMVVSQKDRFERRLGLFPTAVDADGVLHTNTSFGDYPQKIPSAKRKLSADADFTGWMLLSYKKQATSSDSKTDEQLAFDENIKTYWTAQDGKPGQFLQVDLGAEKDVNAIQINFADEQATVFGKQEAFKHRYQILESTDGKTWNVLVDKSKNDQDVPHDYVELTRPVHTRYLKLENLEMPTGCFAISDLRVFGKADGDLPEKVSGFTVQRDSNDRRTGKLSWQPVPGAYAYAIDFGVAPDKLYSSLLVNDATNYDLNSLNTPSQYYFRIRAVGETGISAPSAVVKTP